MKREGGHGEVVLVHTHLHTCAKPARKLPLKHTFLSHTPLTHTFQHIKAAASGDGGTNYPDTMHGGRVLDVRLQRGP